VNLSERFISVPFPLRECDTTHPYHLSFRPFLFCHSDHFHFVIPTEGRNLLFSRHRHSPSVSVTLTSVIPTISILSFRTEGRNLLLPREKKYYVYIMASKSRVLYVGVTGFLMARVLQHKAGDTDGFTKRYNITRPVYYEVFPYVNNAIARETEIKKWRREKKVALILASNRTWEDLAADWGQRSSTGKTDSSLRSE